MLIEGVPFRGKLAKVQIVSDSTHYGPYEPGEYAQRLTLNNKGQVYCLCNVLLALMNAELPIDRYLHFRYNIIE